MSAIKNYLHNLPEEEPALSLSTADSLLLFSALETIYKSQYKTINYRKRLENLSDKLLLASKRGLPVKLFNIKNS